MALDPVEPPEKVQVPPGAAELAVGDRLQADLLLLLDDRANLAVFDLLEFGARDLAVGAALARLLQCRRAQQAADMVGAERRRGSLHPFRPCFLFRLAALAGSQGASKRAPAVNVISKCRRPIPRSCAASPTAPLPTARCLPRWKRSRIVATGKADRGRRSASPRRCGA